MTGIVLAHGKAANVVARHLPNWQATFDEVILVTPADDPLPGAHLVGKSEHRGSDTIARMKYSVGCAAAREAAAVLEYDTLFFTGKLPDDVPGDNLLACSVLFNDINPEPGLIEPYGHSPWVASGRTWRRVFENIGDDQMGWGDHWLALAVHNAGIGLTAFTGGFSRDEPWNSGILVVAAEAVRLGCPVVHGVKTPEAFAAIIAARAEYENRPRTAVGAEGDARGGLHAGQAAQAFGLAQQHHRAGRLKDADTLYRKILAGDPGNAEARHYLGVLADQTGNHDLAVELIRQAVGLNPNNPAAYFNLGEACRKKGLLKEAAASYRRALDLQPALPNAWHNLGTVLREQGKLEDAVTAYQRAVQLQPDFFGAHGNLGGVLANLGRDGEAIAAFRRVVELQPNSPEGQFNLGTALAAQGRLDEAVAAYRRMLELKPGHLEAHCRLSSALAGQERFDEAMAVCRRALEIKPDYAEAHSCLGIALAGNGQFDEAMAAYRRAIELRPEYAEARSNLGAALAEIGQLDEAVAEYREILRLQPEYADGWNNLGSALKEQAKFDEAAAAYRKALYCDPCHANAKFNLSLVLLLRGKLAPAWPLYEARWRVYQAFERRFPQPMWEGGMLSGQRVLLHAEQGFGDAIHFVRYARLVAECGGEVVVECPRALVETFRTARGVREVVAAGEPLPPFDVHLPMLSLPFVFKTTEESIPREVPYLFADPVRREIWRERLGGDRSRVRVGLAWAGNPKIVRLRKRHLSLEKLRPLLPAPGVDFFSLQVDGGAEQIRHLPAASGIIDHTPSIQDFADTAALMMELDLIVSVDTAAAHLAGALGRPVWTMLPLVPDWRWGLDREDNDWYPTMRLFRQTKLGDWEGVIERVVAALGEWSAER